MPSPAVLFYTGDLIAYVRRARDGLPQGMTPCIGTLIVELPARQRYVLLGLSVTPRNTCLSTTGSQSSFVARFMVVPNPLYG